MTNALSSLKTEVCVVCGHVHRAPSGAAPKLHLHFRPQWPGSGISGLVYAPGVVEHVLPPTVCVACLESQLPQVRRQPVTVRFCELRAAADARYRPVGAPPTSGANRTNAGISLGDLTTMADDPHVAMRIWRALTADALEFAVNVSFGHAFEYIAEALSAPGATARLVVPEASLRWDPTDPWLVGNTVGGSDPPLPRVRPSLTTYGATGLLRAEY